MPVYKRRTPKHCCCLPPIVTITTSGSNADYVVSDAITATITVQCGTNAATTTSLTLTSGGISDTYVTGGALCWISIRATNTCGTTIKTWRNYTTPQLCDCVSVANDPPALWGRAGTIVITVSGSTTAAALVIGGSTICASPSACGDITGSYAHPCRDPNRRYLITTHTGCSNYYYYIDVLENSFFQNYPSSPKYNAQMTVASGWFQKASNPYPTLTQVTLGTNLATLLGVGSFNSRSNRQVSIEHSGSLAAQGGFTTLKCHRGTLAGGGGSFDNNSNPGSSDQGHCEFSGLTFTAEVQD